MSAVHGGLHFASLGLGLSFSDDIPNRPALHSLRPSMRPFHAVHSFLRTERLLLSCRLLGQWVGRSGRVGRSVGWSSGQAVGLELGSWSELGDFCRDACGGGWSGRREAGRHVLTPVLPPPPHHALRRGLGALGPPERTPSRRSLQAPTLVSESVPAMASAMDPTRSSAPSRRSVSDTHKASREVLLFKVAPFLLGAVLTVGLLASSWSSLPSLQMSSAAAASFDCSEARSAWPRRQASWCCHAVGRGCDVEKAMDCVTGFSRWRELWPPERQRYCCEQHSVACEDSPAAEADDWGCEERVCEKAPPMCVWGGSGGSGSFGV